MFFFQFSSKVSVLIFLFAFFQLYSVVSWNGKVHCSAGYLFFLFSFFFYWLSPGLIILPRLEDQFVSQNPREVCASQFPGRILCCASTIWSCPPSSFLVNVICEGNLWDYTYYLLLWGLFTPTLAEDLPRRFEWQQVSSISRTLLSILADLINAIVWMISTFPLINNSSGPIVTVPIAPITNGITVTFIFHVFLVLKQVLGTSLSSSSFLLFQQSPQYFFFYHSSRMAWALN